jgi:hypothetical protein
LRNNLIEGNDLGFNSGREKLQGEERSGERAGNRNPLSFDFDLRERARLNDHRPIAFAYAAAAGHERV